jgi:hypothetical protein
MVTVLNREVKAAPDSSVFDLIGRRRTSPIYSGLMTPILETNGHSKSAPLMALVTITTAEKLYALGQAIEVSDGHHVTLKTDTPLEQA